MAFGEIPGNQKGFSVPVGGNGGDPFGTLAAAKTFAGKNCYELTVVFLKVDVTLAPQGPPWWEVNKTVTAGVLSNVPKIGGHIAKRCICLSAWDKFKLKSYIMNIIEEGFQWDGNSYIGWKIKEVCSPCKTAGVGQQALLDKKCPCTDFRSVRLGHKEVNKDTKDYTASNGDTLVIHNPGDGMNFQSVIEQIVAKEDSIPLKCAAGGSAV